MNVVVLLVCFFLAGLFHQGLYILFPFITLFYISSQKESKLTLNPLSRLYSYVVLVVFGFLIVQSLLSLELKIFSIKGWLRFVAYFSFVVLVSYMRLRDIKYFFIALVLYFVLTIPWGIIQFLEMGRYQNITGHSNHFAYVLSMSIYFLIFHKPLKDKKVNQFCIVALFISLILTISTGGLLVLFVLLGYNALKSKKISLVYKLAVFAVFFIAVLVALNFSEKIAYQYDSIGYLSWEFLKERAENYTIDGVNRAGGYGSFVWRVIYWTKLLYTFFAESIATIIFGLGADHLTKGYMPYEFMDKDPHNDFIKVTLEYGVLGLLLFLSFIRNVYKVIGKNFNVIILMVVPMIFGNAIVNYSVNVTLILILMYEFKRNNIKIS